MDYLEAVADEGYFNSQQIKECVENGITPYIPEPDKNRQIRQQGRFDRSAFKYNPQANCYYCPSGMELSLKTTRNRQRKIIWYYQSSLSDCATCFLKAQCLAAKTPYRIITRWEHEPVLETHRARMAARGSEKMQKRIELCEHPFGTLKLWCGWTHFLMRGLEKVRAELSLLMMSYNFKRVLNIVGLAAFRAYCMTRRFNQPEISV